jgi:ABC-type dipeptide/oligopeptide/nickel transport system ATPase component
VPLLTVSNLATAFATSRGEMTAVEDFSFSLGDGEIHSATLMQAAVWPGIS